MPVFRVIDRDGLVVAHTSTRDKRKAEANAEKYKKETGKTFSVKKCDGELWTTRPRHFSIPGCR